MPKKSKPSPTDINTFRAAIEGVTPLKHNKIRLKPKNKSKPSIKSMPLPEEALNLNEFQDLPLVKGDEYIAYKQVSISNKILRKLQKGQYNVDAILDLHGMSIDKAKKAVDSFLQECLQVNVRVALIIHGKGLHGPVPVLKNKLNQWLRSTTMVLAFCSATPKHGSRGALYVLLKCAVKEDFI